MLFLRPCLVRDWLEAALASACIQGYIYSRVVTGTRDSQLLSFIAYEETSLLAFFIFLRFSKVSNPRSPCMMDNPEQIHWVRPGVQKVLVKDNIAAPPIAGGVPTAQK